MLDPGRITLSVTWDGSVVNAVSLQSSRPQADRLLVGRQVKQVSVLAETLFSLCGKAQGVCSRLAVATASGGSLAERGPLLRAVLAERCFEHLWRLWVDWPQVFDWPPRLQEFGLLGGELRRAQTLEDQQAAAGRIAARLRELSRGRAFEDVVRDHLEGRANSGDEEWLGAMLNMDKPADSGTPAFLPDSALSSWLGGIPSLDRSFAQMPTFNGQPAEVGAWVEFHDHPLIRELITAGHLVMARVAARWLALDRDLAALIANEIDDRLVDACTIDGTSAVARVQTARGPLLHRVQLDGDRVSDYVILAPTEWNFHPKGAVPAALLRRAFPSEHAMRTWSQALLLALDPCVSSEVKVNAS